MIAEITIPDIWSMRAAFCIVGIIYMVVCLMIVGTRGFGGWATVLSLWVCGVIILMIITPDPVGFDGPKDGWKALEPRVFNSDGHSVNLKSLMDVVDHSPGYDSIAGPPVSQGSRTTFCRKSDLCPTADTAIHRCRLYLDRHNSFCGHDRNRL